MNYIISGGFLFVGMMGLSMLIPVQKKGRGGGTAPPAFVPVFPFTLIF